MRGPDIDLVVLAEEVRFLRESCGLSDERIAERLGISWATWTHLHRKHPQMGLITREAA